MNRSGWDAADAGHGPVQAYLLGVAERGLPGVAQALVQRGVVVTGSEGHSCSGPTVDRLRQLGVRVHSRHEPRLCPRSVRFLVHGSEIGREHPVRLSATRRGVLQGTAADWLGRWMRGSLGLAVAGRRAASVASAMIGWTLTRAGLDPTVVLGTATPQLGGWARWGMGPHLVVEALETPDGLGPLSPRLAVVLDVETKDESGARIDALRRFLASMPSDGHILVLGDQPRVDAVVGAVGARVEWFSLDRTSAWWGTDLREDRGRYRFRAFYRGRFAVEVRLQVPGRRNVLSALAAVAACGRLDVPALDIKQGLEEFAGVSRDFESRGTYRGVTLVDDEGQDAAAVSEALALGRRAFGTRRLWVVLSLSRGVCDPEANRRYRDALAGADQVVITEVREDSEGGAGTSPALALAAELIAAGTSARWTASLDDAISELDRHLEPGDVLVTLGAGDVGTISDAFIRRLSRDRHRQ
jgi:UDP-N-acetylmuramate--alanine ligase